MKVKIVTDEVERPLGYNTRIIDVETGEELKPVQSLRVDIDGKHTPTVTMEVAFPHLDMEAELKEITWAGRTWRLVE